MADGLSGLGHDGVVRGDDENHDIRDLGASCPHGRERRVARSVQERDASPVTHLNVICTDVLGDASGFSSHDVRAPDLVEQERFSVVHVTHDRHHGGSRLQILWRVLLDRVFLLDAVLLLTHRGEVELIQEQLDVIEVEPLIDGDHEAEVLERGADDLGGGHVHQLRQLGDREELVHANGRPLALLLLTCLFLGSLALLLRGRGSFATALLATALELSHDPLDVLLDRALIDALALLAFLFLALPPLAVGRISLRLHAHLPAGTGADSRLGPADDTSRPLGRGPANGLRRRSRCNGQLSRLDEHLSCNLLGRGLGKGLRSHLFLGYGLLGLGLFLRLLVLRRLLWLGVLVGHSGRSGDVVSLFRDGFLGGLGLFLLRLGLWRYFTRPAPPTPARSRLGVLDGGLNRLVRVLVAGTTLPLEASENPRHVLVAHGRILVRDRDVQRPQQAKQNLGRNSKIFG